MVPATLLWIPAMDARFLKSAEKEAAQGML
jgi:hypothetical protein